MMTEPLVNYTNFLINRKCKKDQINLITDEQLTKLYINNDQLLNYLLGIAIPTDIEEIELNNQCIEIHQYINDNLCFILSKLLNLFPCELFSKMKDAFWE